MFITQTKSINPVREYIQQLVGQVEIPEELRLTVHLLPSYHLPGFTVGIEIKALGMDDIAMINIYISNNAKRLNRKKAIIKQQFSPRLVQGAVARILSQLTLSQDTRNWVRLHEKYYHTS